MLLPSNGMVKFFIVESAIVSYNTLMCPAGRQKCSLCAESI